MDKAIVSLYRAVLGSAEQTRGAWPADGGGDDAAADGGGDAAAARADLLTSSLGRATLRSLRGEQSKGEARREK